MVNRRGLTFWTMWLAGAALACALTFSVLYAHFNEFPPQYRVLMMIGVLASVPVYSFLHVYHKRLNYLSGLLRLLGGWLTLVASLAVVIYLSRRAWRQAWPSS